jgi:hypothetical protein
MDTTRTITFTGPEAMTGMLVSDLRRAGVHVEWAPSQEDRNLTQFAIGAAQDLLASGTLAAMALGVRQFRKRHLGADAAIEGGGEIAATDLSVGVVPGAPLPPFHAVGHLPTEDVSLCGAEPIVLVPGRFDPSETRACAECKRILGSA